MEPILKIENTSVHLWQAFLPDFLAQIPELSLLLNENEMARANRFHFPHHQQRFIIARALLRHILSLYSAISPKDISFFLGPRGKPYLDLAQNRFKLQFNVSHSHDMAVYAITCQYEVGIDIEKIEKEFNAEVAKRFFSEKEFAELVLLPADEKIIAFYKLWAGKEAIIKTLGEGLYVPLNNFSLDLAATTQTVEVVFQQEKNYFCLEHFHAHPEYQSAYATVDSKRNIVQWRWDSQGIIKITN